jgi:hypothetical protein
MATPTRIGLVLSFLLVPCLAGCGPHQREQARQKRPIRGDTVTPVLMLGNTWTQNGPVLISTRLQVQGEQEAEPQLLQLEDVPYKTVPRVTLTFSDGEKEIHKLEDVPLARDC